MSDSIKQIYHSLLRLVFNLIKVITTHLEIRDDTIWLFGAHHGDQFTENTKYLFLYVSNEHNDAVRPIWLSRNKLVVSRLQAAGYEAYYYRTPKALYLKLCSGVVVVSHLLDDIGWWPLIGGAKIVNTLHGVATIKDTTKKVPSRAKDLFRNDYLISTSEYHDSLLTRRSWTRDEDVSLITGYPRDNILFHDIEGHDLIDGEYYEQIAQMSEQSTIISYHPTHRNTSPNPLLDNTANLADMSDFLQDHDAYLLIKPHPSQQTMDDLDAYDRIKSIPPALDMYPVMRNIDILITDYSSIYYDFLLTDRAPVLFSYDLDEYRDEVGIHPDVEYQKLGDVATSYDELKTILHEYLTTEDFSLTEDQQWIRDRTFAFVDGESSQRVYEQIQSKLLDR